MNFNKLTDYIDSLDTTYHIPGGEIIVCKEHEQIYHKTFGFRDYDKKSPAGDSDVYMFFSATKVITMAAVLQLIEHGKLGLYDELSRYFPEFSTLLVADEFVMSVPSKWPDENTPCHHAHETIRIIDLMSMTAGLSYDTESRILKNLREVSNNQATTLEVVAEIAKMPLVYEPRSRWSYSLAHDVLAGVVEKTAGLKYSEYLKKNIFDPLEISELTFCPEDIDSNRYAALYRGEIGPGFTLTGNILPYPEGYDSSFCITDAYESGGAGLWGTAGDYSKVADALANNGVGFNGNRILSDASVKLLTKPYTTAPYPVTLLTTCFNRATNACGFQKQRKDGLCLRTGRSCTYRERA